MNLKYYYWYFTNAIPHRVCDDIITYGNSKKEKIATIGRLTENDLNENSIKDLKKQRDSSVTWLTDLWIWNEIFPYIETANKKAGWNFQLEHPEDFQFTKYKLNQFYDWHCDSWDAPYANPDNKDTNGKIRKLSVTCSLSDPKDYEGGELEFDFRNMDPDKPTIRKCAEISQRGSIVVFPSHVWHRVKPVTKGTRYSLVIWNLGYPFR
jgi:PKHD-type hydroxylase